jgi:multisubunit Na+/H+ antiporter MnhG subunit
MENRNIKTYQSILGISILLIGITLFALLSGSLKLVGIILILVAYLYFATIFYSKISDADNSKYRSRAREQMLKHQFRR